MKDDEKARKVPKRTLVGVGEPAPSDPPSAPEVRVTAAVPVVREEPAVADSNPPGRWRPPPDKTLRPPSPGHSEVVLHKKSIAPGARRGSSRAPRARSGFDRVSSRPEPSSTKRGEREPEYSSSSVPPSTVPSTSVPPSSLRPPPEAVGSGDDAIAASDVTHTTYSDESYDPAVSSTSGLPPAGAPERDGNVVFRVSEVERAIASEAPPPAVVGRSRHGLFAALGALAVIVVLSIAWVASQLTTDEHAAHEDDAERAAPPSSGASGPTAASPDDAVEPDAPRSDPMDPEQVGSRPLDAIAGAPAADAVPSVATEDIPADIARMDVWVRRQRAAELRSDARRVYATRSFARAEELWRESLLFHPSSGDSAAGLARTLARLGRSDEATGWARRAVLEDGNEPRHYELLGDLLLGAERVDEAVETYTEGLTRAPNDARLRSRLRRAR